MELPWNNPKQWTLIVPLAGLLAGCGSEAGPAAAPEPADPVAAVQPLAKEPVSACELITKEELAQIVEFSLNDPVTVLENQGPRGPVSVCRYDPVEPNLSRRVKLTVQRFNNMTPDDFELARQSLIELGGSAREVPGLGDKAYWGYAQLRVFQLPDRHLQVSIGERNDRGTLEKLSQIARIVLQRW